MGLEENSNIVYLIDFGLAKKYRSSKTLEHIPFITNKRLTGNARFASISALKGNEQSRRDDLESICYLLLFFLKGICKYDSRRKITQICKLLDYIR